MDDLQTTIFFSLLRNPQLSVEIELKLIFHDYFRLPDFMSILESQRRFLLALLHNGDIHIVYEDTFQFHVKVRLTSS